MNPWYPFSSEPGSDSWDVAGPGEQNNVRTGRVKAALLAALVVCIVGTGALVLQLARPDHEVDALIPVTGSHAATLSTGTPPIVARPSTISDRRTRTDPAADRRHRPGRDQPGRQRPSRTWPATTASATDSVPDRPHTQPTIPAPTTPHHQPNSHPEPTTTHHQPSSPDSTWALDPAPIRHPEPTAHNHDAPTPDTDPTHEDPSVYDTETTEDPVPTHQPEHDPAPVSIDTFHASTSHVSCADEFESHPVTITWSSTGASRAWFGIDTADASTSPLQEVPVAGSFTWDFSCSNTTTVYTVSVAGDNGTQHRSITVTKA